MLQTRFPRSVDQNQFLFSLLGLILFFGFDFKPSFAAVASTLTCAEIPNSKEKICDKDLAIALPHTHKGLPKADDLIGQDQPLLPESWYHIIHQAFQETSVGAALMTENEYRDWQVVSLRIAPCEPLVKSPKHDMNRICWPEVRLVLQPVFHKFRLNGRFMEAYADDRAFHAIYPVAPEISLSKVEAQTAHRLLKKVEESQLPSNPDHYQPLNQDELKEFVRLRNIISRGLLLDTLQLRSKLLATDSYQSHGLRPEFFEVGNEDQRFIQNLNRFLGKYSQPKHLFRLTGFSLPEGRDPPMIDEWIFVSFRNEHGELKPEPMTVHSHRDGRLIGTPQMSLRGTMSRDDDSFYQFDAKPEDAEDLRDSLILYVPDIRRLSGVIRDREQRLVPNTSCVSCHKLNDVRFDFHNFSYLGDEEITISPRVIRDVELDLVWIERYL